MTPMIVTELPEMSTSSQLANWLQIPIETLYYWQTRGRGPRGIRVGRHTRYPRTAVQAWLDQQVSAAAA